jgi:hypothetical protein
MSHQGPDTSDYDTTVTGERKSVDAGEISEGIEIASQSSAVELTPASDSVDVYLRGARNSVTVRGTDEEVVLYLEGDHNSITLGQGMSLRTPLDTGSATSISRQSFADDQPPELVRQTKDEAYAQLGWFGIDLVSYQQTATEREFCQYCGRDADTIVTRHEEKVLTILGLSLTLKEVATSDECPHCTPNVDEVVDLTEEERRQIYR